MAKVQNNVMVRGLRGLFGDQMVLKTDKAGRTIVSNKPVFRADRVFTPAQRAQQERFRAARVYARSVKHPEIYQAKAAGTPQTPSNIAMSDWFLRELFGSEARLRGEGTCTESRRLAGVAKRKLTGISQR